MELTKMLGLLAVVLPVAYGAPVESATELHPEVLAAMKRDLGLDADQAHARVKREVDASEVIEKLRRSAGSSFGGAWLSDDGSSINVAVTDESLAEEVAAAGAKPVTVKRSLNKLEEAMEKLDSMAFSEARLASEDSNSGIASWWIDVEANKLVLEALETSTEKAKELAAEAGLEESDFEVATVEEMPQTFATIRGGDAYFIQNTSRCSVGFSVNGGFVTAGHCGGTGASTTTSSGERLGSFARSNFPGQDMAFVSTTSGHSLTGTVNGYGGANQRITGNTAVGVGASVCRSGSTTGVRCGTIRQLGATVNYAQGAVRGMTGTNACAEGGDSGGSFYSGAQAQGLTSGGSGNCVFGGTTYYQPLNAVLSSYGLSIVRG